MISVQRMACLHSRKLSTLVFDSQGKDAHYDQQEIRKLRSLGSETNFQDLDDSNLGGH